MCFFTLPNTNFKFSVIFILSSACSFNLDQCKNLLFRKGCKVKTVDLQAAHGIVRISSSSYYKFSEFCSRALAPACGALVSFSLSVSILSLNEIIILTTFKLSSADPFKLIESKTVLFGKCMEEKGK